MSKAVMVNIYLVLAYWHFPMNYIEETLLISTSILVRYQNYPYFEN